MFPLGQVRCSKNSGSGTERVLGASENAKSRFNYRCRCGSYTGIKYTGNQAEEKKSQRINSGGARAVKRRKGGPAMLRGSTASGTHEP